MFAQQVKIKSINITYISFYVCMLHQYIKHLYIRSKDFHNFCFEVFGQHSDQVTRGASSSVHVRTFDVPSDIFLGIIFKQLAV